jgi:hypothetical protein
VPSSFGVGIAAARSQQDRRGERRGGSGASNSPLRKRSDRGITAG